MLGSRMASIGHVAVGMALGRWSVGRAPVRQRLLAMGGYFAPVRPIPVAPIGVGMLSARGL